MRLFPVLLSCLMLVACGKTGALYLPEDASEASASQDQDAAQQKTQSRDEQTTSDGTTD